ncbi:DUF456 domain-containing protein [Pseudogulbenkiania subflava]|uniref:DUF456 domain-containing protein n=1 Tax=Pseudogulbenkiania subflava DSM 22618 TaxID=1123014 RepID=A0A1Y6BNR6_9NEIS|nr:DUF456 family protein [Pseudogulbenkiania subflava]SMF19539.1 hypothetical protein SAMN02745746_01799 [Pseudogulbenkiania subflava DSM 22618]
MDILLYALSALLVLAGLAGTIFPALPGLPLMLGGFALAGWAEGFQHVGAVTLSLLALLTAIGLAVDFVAGLLGAKATGASRQALWGAFLGSLVGLFFALPGVILGPLIGAAIGEFLARRDVYQAGKVGLGTFLGFVVGTVAKIGCACAMLATFALAFVL